jgi:peroxidase
MMRSSRSSSWIALALLFFAAVGQTVNGADELSMVYYRKTCPNVERIVWSVMANRVGGGRMAPAVLRLFFHDCFVNVRALPSTF